MTILFYGCSIPGYSFSTFLLPRAQIPAGYLSFDIYEDENEMHKMWITSVYTLFIWYAKVWISFSGFVFNVCVNWVCSDFTDGKDSHICLWEVLFDFDLELFLWAKVLSEHEVLTWGCVNTRTTWCLVNSVGHTCFAVYGSIFHLQRLQWGMTDFQKAVTELTPPAILVCTCEITAVTPQPCALYLKPGNVV